MSMIPPEPMYQPQYQPTINPNFWLTESLTNGELISSTKL